ncbi:oligosaccharide flippase family protein [Empedobacter falsenii]
MSQLKKGALLSYINLFVTNVTGILVTPFVIKSLGDSEYGLYTLIGAFVGYLSVLDLGLNNAIVRFVALYRAEKSKKSEENFLAISFLIYGLIALLIMIGGVVFYLNTESLFGDTLTPTELEKAKIMLLILIANIAITVPGGAFTGICSGYEQFVFPRLLTLIKHIVRTIMIFVILYKGADALGIVILDSVMNLFFIVGTAFYVFKVLKVKIKLHEYKFYYVKEIFQYSFWIFLFGLVYQFQWRTGQVVLGMNTDTVTVAIYGVGVMLGIYYTTFGNVINGLLLPKAVQSIQSGMNGEQLTQQMIRVGRITLILLLYVLGAFFLTGQDFIYLWVGDTYELSWLIALLIMTVYVLPISQGFGHAVLEAKKLVRFKTLSFLVFCILGVFAGALLSYRYGALGMVSGVVISLFLLQNVMNFYYHKAAELNIGQFFKQTYIRIALPFLAVVAISYYINTFFEVSWLHFAVSNVIYSILFFVAVYGLYMNKEERSIVLKIKKR